MKAPLPQPDHNTFHVSLHPISSLCRTSQGTEQEIKYELNNTAFVALLNSKSNNCTSSWAYTLPQEQVSGDCHRLTDPIKRASSVSETTVS